MSNQLRLVFDTNTLVSSILIKDSTPDIAFEQARTSGIFLFSDSTFQELQSILERPKFDKYVSLSIRRQFILKLQSEIEMVVVKETIEICRDSKDDKLLEVAVNGQASHIITGDKDLLILNPFRDILIVTPSQFLQSFL